MNLQEDWDTCLLNGFYKYPDCNAFYLYKQFLIARGLTDEDVKDIKRMPRGYAQGQITILRFICAYLPKIADILWKHKADEIEKLAKVMCKSSYSNQEQMVDADKWKEEVSEIKKSKRENVINKMKMADITKRFDAYRPSANWSVTK